MADQCHVSRACYAGLPEFRVEADDTDHGHQCVEARGAKVRGRHHQHTGTRGSPERGAAREAARAEQKQLRIFGAAQQT